MTQEKLKIMYSGEDCLSDWVIIAIILVSVDVVIIARDVSFVWWLFFVCGKFHKNNRTVSVNNWNDTNVRIFKTENCFYTYWEYDLYDLLNKK